ncbi:translation elongation factor 2 (EF-2/EF-G) [Desulfitobacterium dichloroeliminans LMG P-21439]|uniref:Elongation factor G n=1 Tax=Desulfitobacterium dichloroeliminans (strain LMG P-21439 / DCA1) TaxID=871963 RepID=L0F985_DESDL|nr:elongation factor G [Desulfitobacterium dichloroeliminans]AGA69493.1 translation elongation factor 2 (EF-2/EF-G) [Desulfitobacterium dichloroeliminans LMG P-21439]
MKTYDTMNLRNICLVGHGGAGKTSLSEACLFSSGATTRMGKVPEGNTMSDSLPEEIKHKVSISTSLIPVEWQDFKINILDTPGYSDFFGEVKSALRVAESGVVVLCGVSGLEVQAELILDLMEEQKLPRVIFINKLERENASFSKTIEQLKESFPNTRFVPLHIPLGLENDFQGVVDILEQKAYVYENDASGKYTLKDIPSEYASVAEEYREILAEAVAEADDDILTKYLDGEVLSNEDLRQALKSALEQNLIVPVLAGSALKNIGTGNLLDFFVQYAPGPQVREERSALVFKTLADPYVGKMSFVRVYGGKIQADSLVYNTLKEKEEKISTPFILRGKNQDPVQSIPAGDIAVIAKLQDAATGDTLCSKDDPVQLKGIDFSIPRLPVAIAPKSKGDEDKLGNALVRLTEEDPTMRVEKNIETKELILYGMGEMHVEILMEKLQRKFGVGVEMKVPRVPYRETIRKSVKVEGKHKKQSGGHGQYGHVWLNLEPITDDEFVFSEEVFGGAVPRQYFPAVEKGIREAMLEGVLAGYPVTGFKATLTDGSYHSVDSSEMAFKLASIIAFRKGAEMATPTLLEPIVEVEVRVPEAYMGDVIGDINGKRGRVLGMDADGKFQVIKAHVPQSEMMRYAIDLKSMTQGRGSFDIRFLKYDEVPSRISEGIINELKAAQGN